jgi:Protein of unknown function (DUF1360)
MVSTETGAESGYADEERPLTAYAGLVGVFAMAASLAFLALKRGGRLPSRIGFTDLVLVGVATHKLSRLIAKDKVTSFLRAPFTRYQGPGAPGEVEEEARGHGLRLATGELLTCPYCIGPWISAAFLFALVQQPRYARLAASALVVLTIADFLQLAYKAAEERV